MSIHFTHNHESDPEEFIGRIDGVVIFWMDHLLEGLGNRPNAAAYYDADNDMDVIFINSQFLTLSQSQQDTILLHELGHIRLGHTRNLSGTHYASGGVFNLYFELCADRFAVEHGADPRFLEMIIHGSKGAAERIAALRQM